MPIEQLFQRCVVGLSLCVLLVSGISHSAFAQASDTVRGVLFERLASASTEREGREVESAVWNFWLDQAPDSDLRALMDQGMDRVRVYDFEQAEKLYSQVIEAAPDYAEAYNQRAFVRFLREHYDSSLSDLEKTLELEPKHFGALAGLYHVLLRQNRTKAAFGAIQEAVTIHPWLKERHVLPEALWPDAYRKLHEPGTEI